MTIIGFSFIKFDCVRNGSGKGSIDVKHNINISNVEKTFLNVGLNKNEVLRIEFLFDVIYGENLGKVSMLGDIIYADTKEIIDETFKTWGSEKLLPKTVHQDVYKFIYSKAIIRALDLSDSLNLPAPIPMPKISFDKLE